MQRGGRPPPPPILAAQPAKPMTTPSPSSGTSPTEQTAPRPPRARRIAKIVTGGRNRLGRFATLPKESDPIQSPSFCRCMEYALMDRNIMDETAMRAQAARETCPFLTAKQAAFYLAVAYSTMKRLRRTGTGPKCRLHGRTWRYHIDDIEAWSGAHAR